MNRNHLYDDLYFPISLVFFFHSGVKLVRQLKGPVLYWDAVLPSTLNNYKV